jgi:hypothetical protein
MTVDEIWAQLESDMAWRQAELRVLSNLHSAINRETEKGQLRRALLVMLYAHAEGFCKIALLTYVNAVNKAVMSCTAAVEPLVAAAFSDVFHALTYGDPKQKVFLLPPPTDQKLTVFARQREFIAELPRLLARPLEVPDTVVNTEDNLSSRVVRRNLYRLGFPEDLLKAYDAELDELVRRRNNIAHGADSDPVKESDYERLRKAVFQAMDELALSVVSAVEHSQFIRVSAPQVTAPSPKP